MGDVLPFNHPGPPKEYLETLKKGGTNKDKIVHCAKCGKDVQVEERTIFAICERCTEESNSQRKR